jgi:hypothetical protein
MSGKESKSRKRVDDAEAESYQPPKIPKTQVDKDAATRLVVVLEGAALETVKVSVHALHAGTRVG